MAQVPPSGVGPGPAPAPLDTSSITNPPKLTDNDDWVKAPPPGLVPYQWTSNKTYGRVQTKLCYADGRELKQEERKKDLQQRLQDYQENPSSMTPQQAIADRSELGSIYQAQNPGETYMSSGPTQEETNYTNEQAAAQQESNEHIDQMEEDPFWWVAESAGKLGASPHQVSVLHKQMTGFGEGMSKLGDAKESFEKAGSPDYPTAPGSPYIQE